MKIIFMGTPDFALESLNMLIENHEICAVVTQPDKPNGRGKKIIHSPVKEKALLSGIPVLQPEKIRSLDFSEELKKFEADLFVVVAYGQILPSNILNMPKYGCINVHGSCLPMYRGAAPIQWAVINGDTKTGVTIMFMNKGMDTGDILLKEEINIDANDNFGIVYDKLSKIGAKLLREVVEKLENGLVEPMAQEHDKATYAPMITKELRHIKWNKSCLEIINLIRGLNPSPNAYAIHAGETLKILKVESTDEKYEDEIIGSVVDINKKGFVVKAFDGGILVTEIQASGKKKMNTGDYLRGHSMDIGSVFE